MQYPQTWTNNHFPNQENNNKTKQMVARDRTARLYRVLDRGIKGDVVYLC
jgi:hypothetical protein